MEERTIKVDLTTAKQWFKEGGFMKEIALKAFKEEELKEECWEKIKSFNDALEALNLPLLATPSLALPRHARAILMLSIIKEALNGKDWNPSLNRGDIYYSWCRWYPIGDYIPKGFFGIANFKDLHNGKVYTLVGGGVYDIRNSGLGSFGCTYGSTNTNSGLLSCKSPEIAMHLTKYFGKIIFDAIYGQYTNYEWV